MDDRVRHAMRIFSRHRRHVALTAMVAFLAGATLEHWLDRP